MIEWYVGFHAPHKECFWTRFGHVECFGYTQDETWLFIDPRRSGTQVVVTHLHDEVEGLLASRFTRCSMILRTSRRGTFTVPFYPPMTCAAMVGHILGVRAFTIAGLRSKLLRAGAEVIHDASAKREPRGQESA